MTLALISCQVGSMGKMRIRRTVTNIHAVASVGKCAVLKGPSAHRDFLHDELEDVTETACELCE